MIRTEAEWASEYKKRGALWIHDGNMKHPHTLHTSGKHSNGYFNSRLVIDDDELLYEAGADLLEKILDIDPHIVSVTCVVGPQTGATRLAELLSQHIMSAPGKWCSFASPTKTEEDGHRRMVLTRKEQDTVCGEKILLCEDVISTGGSVELTARAVTRAGGTVLPYVLVLVNRSGLTKVNGRRIIALTDRPLPMWEPSECPLCAGGSEAIFSPKDNWARLKAEEVWFDGTIDGETIPQD